MKYKLAYQVRVQDDWSNEGTLEVKIHDQADSVEN
jgi:hypothetical protein